jgi:hypothetical protein
MIDKRMIDNELIQPVAYISTVRGWHLLESQASRGATKRWCPPDMSA